ncbi:MAG TPA: hypothetical protein VF898_09180, partial [Chloroflexota bacterium]
MNPPLTWSRMKVRIARRSPQRDGDVHRVAARLAAQTVGLVLVMLIVLEGVVYVITRQDLLGSLETALRIRAGQADPTACSIFHLSCSRAGNPGPNRGPGRGPGPRGQSPPSGSSGPGFFSPTNGPSDASATYVDSQLRIVHSDGVLGSVLLRPEEARLALQSGQEQCCTVQTYKGQEYLVYTAPLRAGGKVVGVVQTGISEHQFLQTMSSLQEALLVVALLGLLGSAMVSVVLVRRALRPIRLAMQRQRDFVADAAHELRTPLAI